MAVSICFFAGALPEKPLNSPFNCIHIFLFLNFANNCATWVKSGLTVAN
jgi:hypothetical protein